MKTKNIFGVIEEMTQKEYEEKIERGMQLEIVKEVKPVKEVKKPAKKPVRRKRNVAKNK